MEQGTFKNQFSEVFEKWRNNPKQEESEALTRSLSFAAKNGIDLVMRVPKRVLLKMEESPMTRGDFMNYASQTDEESFIFDIPSDTTRESVRSGRNYKLKVEQSLTDWHITLSDDEKEIAGFGRESISSIEPK